MSMENDFQMLKMMIKREIVYKIEVTRRNQQPINAYQVSNFKGVMKELVNRPKVNVVVKVDKIKNNNKIGIENYDEDKPNTNNDDADANAER